MGDAGLASFDFSILAVLRLSAPPWCGFDLPIPCGTAAPAVDLDFSSFRISVISVDQWSGFAFPISAMSRDGRKPRGVSRGPDEPAVGLTGWKFAAPQPVIVPAAGRRPSPERSRRGAAQPGVERSKSAKPTLRPSACVPQPDPHPP
jgi:hypothetical protein